MSFNNGSQGGPGPGNVNIPQLISATQGTDNQARNTATKQLQFLEQRHFANYMLELCRILGSNSEQEPVRQGAGLLLKNCVGGNRSESYVTETRKRWNSLDSNIRNQLKQTILDVLGVASRSARQTAVNVISNLALIETLKNWTDLVPHLIQGCSSSNVQLRYSSLKCIGQIAEDESTHEDLSPFSSKILECIANGMGTKDSPEVQAESMRCLLHILELISSNMEADKDCRIIFQMICVGASSKDHPNLRLHSFMCIRSIVELYYDVLKTYMPAIFSISRDCIHRGIQDKEDEDVTKQAIEVWSSTAEVELYRMDENQSHYGFINKSLQQLVPIYLSALLKQRDTFDEDEWTIRKAAACSLELFALVAKDNMLSFVLPFVEKNIGVKDWRNREAALCAFGYILDGPNTKRLESLVSQILPPVLSLTSDKNEQVRQTAVWTFGRICMYVPQVTKSKHIDNNTIMSAIVRALNDVASITNKACWCIASLTKVKHSCIYSQNNTYNMIATLLTRGQQSDVTNTLITAIHEAINGVIEGLVFEDNSNYATMLQSLLPEMVKQMVGQTQILEASNNNNNNNNNSSHDLELCEYRLASLLTTVQVILHKLSSLGPGCLEMEQSNTIMQVIVRCAMLSQNGQKEGNQLIFEESLGLLTHIARAIRHNFSVYLMHDTIQNMLFQAVETGLHGNVETCRIGVGTLGDVFTQCAQFINQDPSKLQLYSDKIVGQLLQILMDNSIGIDLKSHIIDALTDILIAHGPHANRYNREVFHKCLQIGCFKPPSDAAEEMLECFNEIRVSIMDLTRSCFVELAAANNIADFGSYVNKINMFFKALAEDIERTTPAVIKAAITLLIEAAEYCENQNQPSVKSQLRTPFIQKLLETGGRSKDRNLAQYAQEAFQRLQR